MQSALVASLLLLAAAAEPTAPTPDQPASPPAVTAPAQPAATPATSPGSRRVCREETRPNSRFTTKICKTTDEWAQRTETARQAFSEVVDRPVVMVCPPAGC